MKVSQLLGLLAKIHAENGDCEVLAGLASSQTEFTVVDAAYLEHEPPQAGLGGLHPLRPRVVLALDLP